MKGYELSAEALADLLEIWIYIAQDNPTAADKLEADIYQACELLAKNPKREDLPPGVARELFPEGAG